MITGTWEQTPRGVTYTRRHTEYQEFPEEFFSGADTVIYFGDTFIDDITGLQFVLSEQVRPVYGYASYTWDVVARGIRLLNGSFRIAFREAGYLYDMLERLGDIAARTSPALGTMLSGTERPQWQAGAMQTVAEILGKNSAPRPTSYILIRPPEYDIPPQNAAIMLASMLGQKLNMVTHWRSDQRLVIMGGREFKPYMVENNQPYMILRSVCETLGYQVHFDSTTQNITIAKDGRAVAVVRSNEYRLIQLPGDRSVMPARDLGQRLGLPVDWNGARGTVIIGGKEFRPQRVVDNNVYVFIREVAETHGYAVFWYHPSREIIITPAGGGIITPDRYKVVPGQDRAVMPAQAVRIIVNAREHNQFKIAADGIYYFGRRFERVDGVYSEPGVYVREVLENLDYSVHWLQNTKLIVYVPPGRTISPLRPATMAKAISDYEAEVWADPAVPERGARRHLRPYFYGSSKQAPLLETGFDIYIVYGPLPHHVKQRLDVLPSYISYNTTVKAIRNVQLTGCAQVLDPTGRPIEEEYTFIARDAD